MDKWFQIGSFCFCIVCESDICIPDHFLQFQTSNHFETDYTYHLRVIDQLPLPEGKILADRADLKVYGTQTLEIRQIGIKGQDASYALYREISDQAAEIFLVPDAIDRLHCDPVFTSLFALERQMQQRDSLILHCAYLIYNQKAILFSAPSGTGKSTQAALWEQYRSAHIVNGDRALIRKIEGQWNACGWPVCGSSGICELSDTPIRAIVMLKQGKKNSIEPLSPIQAFTLLFEQLTINKWNKEFVQNAISCIEDLIKHVSVYQLTCDISENAVACLEKDVFYKDNQQEQE